MLHDLITRLIRQHFYVISYERYKNEMAQTYIERYVAKHPLLRPELIVLNDQPFGFRQTQKELEGLEKYPIFCEIEYSEDEDGTKYVDHFDLYSEAKIRVRERLSDLISLATIYDKTVQLERIKRINDPTFHVMVAYSKLGELFVEEFLEQDMEDELISQNDLEAVFELHLASYTNFLFVLDEVLFKGHSINSLDKILIP